MDIMLQRILSLIPDRHGADAEFARSLGYKSGNVVTDWRAGRSGSYRGKLREIAEKYNVTVDWLCGGRTGWGEPGGAAGPADPGGKAAGKGLCGGAAGRPEWLTGGSFLLGFSPGIRGCQLLSTVLL